MMILGACGGGGPVDKARTITYLRFSPSTALQMPGGVTTLSGTIDFADTGANVSALHLSTGAGANLTMPISLPGVTNGTPVGNFISLLTRPDITHSTSGWKTVRVTPRII